MQVITRDTAIMNVGYFTLYFDDDGCTITPMFLTDPPGARFRVAGHDASNALLFYRYHTPLFRALRDGRPGVIPEELEPYCVRESEAPCESDIIPSMKRADDLPIIPFATQQDWEAWLEEHHADAKGIWLKFAKKEAGIASVSYMEAVESALCYGWIDAQKASFDEQYWLQKFTPRSPKSVWSKVNRDKATALIESGRMRPAGLRQVELAKANGRWDAAYESQSKISVPDDFQRELDNNPQAQEFFNTLNSVNRYAILYRIQTAKKPETRAARIQKFIAMLEKHEKIYP
jgi:uncharacterized protein YdeI (YjbR/CyaY-like superfamily)